MIQVQRKFHVNVFAINKKFEKKTFFSGLFVCLISAAMDHKRQRKPKIVETDPHRIQQRMKQVQFGLSTRGYQNFIRTVPEEVRDQVLRIPDVFQKCSKRSWDGQVRKWRRELHQYDSVEKKEEEINRLAEEMNSICMTS